MKRTLHLALLAAVVLLLAACGTARRAAITSLVVTVPNATVKIEGVEKILSIQYQINGRGAGTLNGPLAPGTYTLPLEGLMCYGSNLLQVSAQVVGNGGVQLTLERSATFDYTPDPPQLVLASPVGAEPDQFISVPVGIDSDVRFGCPAALEFRDASGALLAREPLMVPGQTSVVLPPQSAEGTYDYTLEASLGDWRVRRPFQVEVGLPVVKGQLELILEGVAAADVLVNQGSQTVFNGTVNGSTVLELPVGSYTVDGLPLDGYVDPPATDVEVLEGQTTQVTLTYTQGTPPPPDGGITLVEPADGAVITEPRFNVVVDLADPGQYVRMDVQFTDMGILDSWYVDGNSHFVRELILDPTLYNGPHDLLVRAQKLDGTWVNGPTHAVTLDVPWNASAWVEYQNLPPLLRLVPGEGTSFTATVRSRNGFEGTALLSGDQNGNVVVSVSPSSVVLTNGGSQNVTVTVQVPADAVSGEYAPRLYWQDEYGLRRGSASFTLQTSRPPQVSLDVPAKPTAAPVTVTANVSDDGTLDRVEFYLDGNLVATDTEAPYSWSWDPGLQANGVHTVRALAVDTLAFSGEAQASFDLSLPFGVRDEVALPGVPTAGPVVLGSGVYWGGDGWVARVDSDTLALAQRAVSGQVLELWNDQGILYFRTTQGVYYIGADLTGLVPVWEPGTPVGVRAGSAYFASGSVLRAAGTGPWSLDVGEAIVGLGTDSNYVYVVTPTRILAYAHSAAAAPVTYERLPTVPTDGFDGWGRLWLVEGTRLVGRDFALNPVQDPSALDAASWSAAGVTVAPDALAAPDGSTTAEQVTAGVEGYALGQTVDVKEGETYTFSFWAYPGAGSEAYYAVSDGSGNPIVPETDYAAALTAGSWSRVAVTFTVPAGVGQVVLYPLKREASGSDPPLAADVDLYLWGVRLDVGNTALDPAPAVTYDLCGAYAGRSRTSVVWIHDAGGCLTRLDDAGPSLFHTFAGPLAAAPVTDGPVFATEAAGGLVALDAAGAVLEQQTPVTAVAPVGALADAVWLWQAYDDGTARRMDPLP